jgi:hypothetical protein
MNISAIAIRRPVFTVMVTVAMLVLGAVVLGFALQDTDLFYGKLLLDRFADRCACSGVLRQNSRLLDAKSDEIFGVALDLGDSRRAEPVVPRITLAVADLRAIAGSW